MSESQYEQWSQNLMASLKRGGIWGVPRSGLTFRKSVWNTLELAEVADMGQDFHKYQIDDYKCIRRNMAMAGVGVTDPRNLLRNGNGGGK